MEEPDEDESSPADGDGAEVDAEVTNGDLPEATTDPPAAAASSSTGRIRAEPVLRAFLTQPADEKLKVHQQEWAWVIGWLALWVENKFHLDRGSAEDLVQDMVKTYVERANRDETVWRGSGSATAFVKQRLRWNFLDLWSKTEDERIAAAAPPERAEPAVETSTGCPAATAETLLLLEETLAAFAADSRHEEIDAVHLLMTFHQEREEEELELYAKAHGWEPKRLDRVRKRIRRHEASRDLVETLDARG